MEKIYQDPEIGPIVLVKSTACRKVSIRVHPADGVRVIIPRSLSYDEGLRFFMLKRDWVIGTAARQKRKISDALASGKAVGLLGNGAVVRSLMSEIVFVRADGPESGAGAGAAASGSGRKAVLIRTGTEQVEDLRQSGRTWLSLDRPVFRKTLSYSGNLPGEGSAALDGILKKCLIDVLRHEAKIILPRKTAFFADRFGFKVGNVTVKHNSSNWGSCSRRGNINLNLNLVRLPEPLCDYVILHELCHLRHPDHGPGFHSLLEKLCTDNIVRQALTDDPCVRDFVAKINSSRSVFPVHKTLEREMKGYRLI